MALLSSSEVDSIVSDVSDIIGDSTIGTTIRYSKSGTTGTNYFDPSDPEIPNMYAVSSVSAFKSSFTLDEVSQSGGLIEISDVKFIIVRGAVSGVLSVDDRVAEAGTNYQSATTYQIISISKDPLSVAYFLQARAL